MKLHIDSDNAVPPFKQIVEQITEAVKDGKLPTGSQLPSVRDLATQLGVAANTAAKAYRLLEENQVVETKGRLGTFTKGKNELSQQAHLKATKFVAEIRSLGLSDKEISELVAQVINLTVR